MRTKTLLLTAALSLAAAASSMAQVYSVNAVGYVNKVLSPGFSLIANQLIRTPDAKLDTVLAGVPAESYVYKYNNTSGLYEVDVYTGVKWINNDTGADSTTTINPGEGFFFANTSGADVTVTFVGEVPQGNVGMTLPAARFSLVASKVPQVVTLGPAIGFPNIAETYFLRYVNGAYVTLVNTGTEWIDNDTSVATPATAQVGEGFFINPVGGEVVWTRTFSVN